MGKRTTLLATVALPIASMIFQPVQAAMVRPEGVAEGTSRIINVQSEGELSEEELLRQRRANRKKRDERPDNDAVPQRRTKEERPDRKNRETGREQQQDRENAREERRQKQREAQGEEQQQQDRQNAREERRKKQREAQGEEQQQQERQNAREERRKKQREAQGEEQQQQERQNAREERRKKQREVQAEEQQQQDRQNTREERRKKQREAQAEEQQQQDRQNAREERRKKQREAEGEQQQQDERLKAREERRQRQQDAEAQREERQDERVKAREERRERREGERERPRRERDQERERIARDPSNTLETIILPLVGGAAVLDSDKDWGDDGGDLSREERRRQRAEERRNVRVRVPESDRDAQVGWDGQDSIRYEPVESERGERRDRRPRYEQRGGWDVEREFDNRAVINFEDRIIVRSDDGVRLSRRAAETYFEDLPNGRVREVIVRPNGDRVVTIRNRYGEVIQRSRINRAGREYVMFYAPEIDRDNRPTFEDPGERLPPMRLTIPVEDYIIDTSSDEDQDYREFLRRPPVEPVERVYTLDEVKYSARIRDKVRRIDLDTITFETGSAEISMNQASSLRKVAEAINEILGKDPGETFLIEGHTDAVGSDESNLVLSDERAEAVANILTDVYEIAPENLATQGYGERFLKIDTGEPEQLNRRVTIRRVTPLVKPVAMAE